MLDDNIDSPPNAPEEKINFIIYLFSHLYTLKANSDSTRDNFHCSIEDKTGTLPSLTLEYRRNTEELSIQVLESKLKCTLLISESAMGNGLNGITPQIFTSHIIKYERHTDQGIEISYDDEIDRVIAKEIEEFIEEYEPPYEMKSILLDLTCMVSGLTMASAAYKNLLNSY